MRKKLLNGSLLTFALVASPSLRAEESMVDKGQRKFNSAVDSAQNAVESGVNNVKTLYNKVHNLKMPEVEMSSEGERLLMGGAPVGEGSGSLKAWEAETKAVVKAGFSLKLALLLYGRDNADAKSLLKMNEQLMALEADRLKLAGTVDQLGDLETKVMFDSELKQYVPKVEGLDKAELAKLKQINEVGEKFRSIEARKVDLIASISQKTETLQVKLQNNRIWALKGSIGPDGNLTPAGLEIIKSNGARWSKAFGGLGVAMTTLELGVDTFNVFQNKESPGLIPMQSTVELVKAQVK